MKAVVIAVSAAAALMAGSAFADGKKIYETTCIACHKDGVAGAPKMGDKAAWAPRIKTGEAALIASVTKGKGAMPPKAGNAALTDADIKAAVQYMIAQNK
jgi:cytochrome c5